MIDEKKLIEDFKHTFSDSVLNQTFGFGKYTLLEVFEKMVERQPKTDWIPCEERLPSENGAYLVCFPNGDVDIIEFSDGHFWWNVTVLEVIAWQPLPQPYKKEGGSQ